MGTWGDLIADAIVETGARSPGDAIEPEEYNLAARKLDRLLDQQAAQRAYCYTTAFELYTLTANHAPHLIGPNLVSPDFATPNNQARPLRIESSALVLTDQAQPVDLPMNIRDRAWWAQKRVKSLASNVSTDLFYDDSFPSGALNFWPVPNFAYGVRLEMWMPLGQVPRDTSGTVQLAAKFAAPESFEELLFEELVLRLCRSYGRAITPDMREALRRARAVAGANNIQSPRTQSVDWGTEGRRRGRGGFNYYSGLPIS